MPREPGQQAPEVRSSQLRASSYVPAASAPQAERVVGGAGGPASEGGRGARVRVRAPCHGSMLMMRVEPPTTVRRPSRPPKCDQASCCFGPASHVRRQTDN